MIKPNTSNKISIIVPTYNERETIISFLEKVTHQISKNGFDAGIIVVDDGSPDGTAELINDFSKTHPNVTLLNRHEKRGLASACVYGFSYTTSPILEVKEDGAFLFKKIPCNCEN